MTFCTSPRAGWLEDDGLPVLVLDTNPRPEDGCIEVVLKSSIQWMDPNRISFTPPAKPSLRRGRRQDYWQQRFEYYASIGR